MTTRSNGSGPPGPSQVRHRLEWSLVPGESTPSSRNLTRGNDTWEDLCHEEPTACDPGRASVLAPAEAFRVLPDTQSRTDPEGGFVTRSDQGQISVANHRKVFDLDAPRTQADPPGGTRSLRAT